MESTYLLNNIGKKIFVFSCCIPVKGSNRGAIYDLQRETIEFVPNSMIDFLHFINSKDVAGLIEVFEQKYDTKIVREYINFLIEKEFIFFSKSNNFPNLNLFHTNEDNSRIEFMNLCVSQNTIENLIAMVKAIEWLGVKRLHLNFSNVDSVTHFKTILDKLRKSRIVNLSISLPFKAFSSNLSFEDERIKSVYIYESPTKKIENVNYRLNYFFLTKKMTELFEQNVNFDLIAVNTKSFSLAQQYNTGLYKTILVLDDGNVKFDYNEKINYGNLFDRRSLKIAIKKMSKLWSIHRDQLTPCKDCELRYGCTINKVPVKNKDSYKIDCNYNPYTNEIQ